MKTNSSPTISLVIPIYNEADHLEKFLTQIDQLDLGFPKELIFVDDFSKDNSAEILKNFQFKNSQIKIFQQPKNSGKGAAIRRGLIETSGAIVGVQDADFEYSFTDIAPLLQPILENRADVAFGSRFKKANIQVHRTFHYLINRILTLLSNLFSGLYLSDMETCYKFFRAEIIKNIHLESNRFGFEPEVTAKVARLKVRVVEIPISYFPRNYLEGKKITWKDGIAAFRHIFFYNVIANKKVFFKEGMPKEYLYKGWHLL